MVNGFILRCVILLGLIGVLMVGGGRTVVAGPPDKVVQVDGGSPIEIQVDKYGFEWCVVGDVNNPPFPGNRRHGAFKGAGVIPYKYRITRTEISNARFIEFLTAFAPFFDGDVRSSTFTGVLIFAFWDGEMWQFTAGDGMDHVPAQTPLRQAARFCNWLHNGKINEEWAFLSGVYDTSTFTQNEDGSFNDDYTVLPGARYWIPNLDEYLKATYYDPNRWDTARGGWWEMPNGSNEMPRAGFADSVGVRDGPETNAGLGSPFTWWGLLSSGFYPQAQSPWGLLDTSGGVEEMGLPFAWGSSFWRQWVTNEEAGSRGTCIECNPNGSGDYGFRIVSPVPANRIGN